MPGTMKTPLGPSDVRCNSTNRSSSGISVPSSAVTMRNPPASSVSLRAFRLISCRYFEESPARYSSHEPGRGRNGATPSSSSRTTSPLGVRGVAEQPEPRPVLEQAPQVGLGVVPREQAVHSSLAIASCRSGSPTGPM